MLNHKSLWISKLKVSINLSNGIISVQPDGDPNDLCRIEIFNKNGPCDVERRAKCTDKKEVWIKCVDRIEKGGDVTLKEEFREDEDKIREIPIEKLVNYIVVEILL